MPIGLLGASLLGGGIQGASNILGSTMQNIGNRVLSNRAQNYELEMWNKSNEYNSPQAQMARLKQAGLNPNLVYGSGSVSGNTSSQAPRAHIPEYKAPMVDPNIVFNVLNTALGAIKTQADTQKVQTEVGIQKEYASWHPGNLMGQMLVDKHSMLAAKRDFDITSLYPYQKEMQEQNLERIRNQIALEKDKKTISGYDATLAKELFEFKKTNPYMGMLLNLINATKIFGK